MFSGLEVGTVLCIVFLCPYKFVGHFDVMVADTNIDLNNCPKTHPVPDLFQVPDSFFKMFFFCFCISGMFKSVTVTSSVNFCTSPSYIEILATFTFSSAIFHRKFYCEMLWWTDDLDHRYVAVFSNVHNWFNGEMCPISGKGEVLWKVSAIAGKSYHYAPLILQVQSRWPFSRSYRIYEEPK